MPRTLTEVREDVLRNVARTGDAVASSMADLAINAGIEMIWLLFDLPESRTLGTITFNSGEKELLVGPTKKLLNILTADNTTDDIPMGFIPLDLIDTICPSDGIVRFYSRDGDSFLVRDTPSKTTIIEIRYTTHPPRLTDGSQFIPFNGYDSQLVAVATAITWACLEEVESSDLWNKVAQALNIPYVEALKVRKVLEGLPVSGG